MAYNRRFGPWRSLASALAWGARGPEFKSRRPDQIPLRVTDTNPHQTSGLASNWSPFVDARRKPFGAHEKHHSNSWHLSHPRKTCHSRHFPCKLLILFVEPMSGSSEKPDIHPTFPSKNPTFWLPDALNQPSHNPHNTQEPPAFRSMRPLYRDATL